MEILVSLSIILVLAGLLFGVSQRVLKSARAAKCLSNLKSCGAALVAQGADNNGRLAMAWGGAESNLGEYPDLTGSPQLGLTWMQYLKKTGHLDDWAVAACPSVSPYRYRYESGFSLQAYGLRRWASAPYKPSAILQAVDRPSSYILLADSIVWPGGSQPTDFPGQRYFATFPGNRQDRIHARHNGLAHIFFLDGSVRGLTAEEITETDSGWDEKSIDSTDYTK